MMKGRTAIITGGSRGIGRAVSVRLAELGANVVINYTSDEAAAATVADICRSYDVEAITAKGNVALSSDCEAVVAAAVERFGGADILVNNAGITRDSLLVRMDDEDFDEVIAVNLRGTYRMMKAVARTMIKKRYGRIINLSSVVGQMGNAGQVNYAASKAGVIGMTKSFAREVAARSVTVNAVAPGFIATNMTAELPEDAAAAIHSQIPMKRIGTPEDVAAVVAFLASDDASYVTGQVIGVNGGML